MKANFQKRVYAWLLRCFGKEIADDRRERSHRFLEEALELAQATGTTKEEAQDLAAYVFDRPAGQIADEIGGTALTLAALAEVNHYDLSSHAEAELLSVHVRINQIREKRSRKPNFGARPQ